MPSVFRRIRFKLIEENRFRNFIKYSLSEIILVIVGILIALALNDWNSKRIERNDLQEYYSNLVDELEDLIQPEKKALESIEADIQLIEDLITMISSENLDSFRVVLPICLKALELDCHPPRNHPVFDEFLSKNYFTKIGENELQQNARNLSQVIKAQNSYRSFSQDEHKQTITPFVMGNIDYSEIRTSEDLIFKGKMLIDYDALFKNLEFWNILQFRLKHLQTDRRMSMGAIAVFDMFKQSLEDIIDARTE
jgi:hypothetical protein